MIESILPAYVVAVDLFDDPPDARLFDAEERVVSQAVEKRRREFTTARFCARRALALLGRPPAPILPGQRGEPRWPMGIVGSITHCAGYRGAVVGEAERVRTIGIDAEPNAALTDGVLEAVSLAVERDDIRMLTREHPRVHWDRLLFSAKESVYKAWYPLAHRFLDFEEAMISIDPLAGTFSARLLVDGPMVNGRQLTGFTGRWLASDGLLLTTIVVPTMLATRHTPVRVPVATPVVPAPA
ncbi:4'-phosphopantetheinyl transferase family protein [Micromonospora echinofusca]|uniref:4'-phosphopantetheinyl transferase superfamily protein n=1 Tax=Micromonospora echinofusca TaxID=47858 RepID=A0ABS3VX21_MICEH|nr:4'-phosphopantetheinyl transferase superfamily protein [Micromonospora echinofusca]MBO4208924.1 4'-phosphopantetheinyl transferase superfamily protein [Micromonospora echinofusca]